MSLSKTKEVFYSLDPFPTNPTWRVNGHHYLSTWKSVLCTLLILLTSLGLSYDTIRMLVTNISELPSTQTFERGDGIAPDPFFIAFRFQSQQDINSLDVSATESNSGDIAKTELQDSCPVELKNLDGWMVCYLISPKSTPFR